MTRGAQVLNDMWEKLKAERNDVVNEETFFWLCKALKALEQGDVLGKIRAEIERLHYHPKLDFIKNDDVVDMTLDIIDKYKSESEGKE